MNKSQDKTINAITIFNNHAHAYQEKYMDVSIYSHSIDVFCDNITPDARILEIACGPGNITKYLLKKRTGFKIFGIDLAPAMIDLARINNPGTVFQVMDARDIHTIHEKYHGIMCGFCLPYLTEDEAMQLIRNASQLLLPGGVCYLSTMEEDEYNRSGLKMSSAGDELYMYYHSAGFLIDALKDNGFHIIKMQRQDFLANDGIKNSDLIIIADKLTES